MKTQDRRMNKEGEDCRWNGKERGKKGMRNENKKPR